jgi:uncharacterized membrane protein/protein-disulfide isomerase
MKLTRPSNPLSYFVYLGIVVIIALIGLADAIYLSISHYRVYTDIGYKSICAISKAINCDTVSQSPYAVLFGLPVALWGVIGYVLVLLLLLFSRNKTADRICVWSLIFWITLVFSCSSVVLALVSTYLVRSYCILCIVTYGINLSLLYSAWIIRRRFSKSGLIEDTREDILFLWQKRAKSIPLFVTYLVAVLSTWMFFPVYWNFNSLQLPVNIPQGTTASGHPWLGAAKPVLDITEFTDYQCFQCKKMHFYLRQLIAENPGKIRIIHNHYPMDHEFNPIVNEPFHVGAGKMALLAAFAASKKIFWEMNDLLYNIDSNRQTVSVKELAETLGLHQKDLAGFMRDPDALYRLRHDIWTGNKLGITGTPAYLINGKIYEGQIPPEIIRKALE